MKNNKKVDLIKDVTMKFSVAELVRIHSALHTQIKNDIIVKVTPAAIVKEVKRIRNTKNHTIEDLELLASMSAFTRIDQQLREVLVDAAKAELATKEDLDDAKE